jgi:methanethiol S-methyltransferase
MWKTVLKMMAATAVYAVVHSALASRQAKDAAANIFGERRRNAFYRGFFNLQAVLTFAGLALYARRLSGEVLYDVRGPARLLLRTGQLSGIAFAAWAAREVGPIRLLGIAGVRDWISNEPVIAPEPEAQGPSLAGEDALRVRGPFRWMRHPLNFAPLPIFWFNPRMTVRLLAYNLAMTPYMVLGSIHEEARLRRAYGDAYEAYERSGVSFYLPGPEPQRLRGETLDSENTAA